jgi:ADP-ribose pyrophosphatase
MDEPRDPLHPEGNPWRTLASRVVYANPWITVEEDEVIRPDGDPGIYGVVRFPGRAVGVVALDEADRVVLVGQHRYALERYSWEIPEGGASEDDPLAGAKRELLEETGLVAAAWEELITVDLSNSVTDESATVYVARGLTAGEAEPEGTERLQVRWVPFDDAVAMTMDGRITDAMSVVGLQAVALRRALTRDPR